MAELSTVMMSHCDTEASCSHTNTGNVESIKQGESGYMFAMDLPEFHIMKASNRRFTIRCTPTFYCARPLYRCLPVQCISRPSFHALRFSSPRHLAEWVVRRAPGPQLAPLHVPATPLPRHRPAESLLQATPRLRPWAASGLAGVRTSTIIAGQPTRRLSRRRVPAR